MCVSTHAYKLITYIDAQRISCLFLLPLAETFAPAEQTYIPLLMRLDRTGMTINHVKIDVLPSSLTTCFYLSV